MPEFVCPCCGAPRADRAPVEALRHADLNGRTRRAVDALIAIYPRTLTMYRLAELVYADDPTGGPAYAVASLSVAFTKSKPDLEPTGWRIGRRAPGSHEIGLWPVDPSAGVSAE